MNVIYQKKFDVLYITFADRSNTACTEEYDDVAVFRDRTTRKLTGITIMDFFARYEAKKLPKFPDEVKIDFERDVLPYVN